MTKLYQYNDNNFRIIVTKNEPNIDKMLKKKKKENDYYIPQTDSEEIERISISRSRRMISEYALSNDFDYFFTATVNSELCDRFSLQQTQENIRNIMKSIKRKNPNFKYLFITEKHKNGAFHFHGLCTAHRDMYINHNGYFSSYDFDKLGFNSFSIIKDKTKCANYIVKYITKECIKNEQGSVYFCSKGLKRAVTYDIMPIDLNLLGKKIYENDFVKICDFRLDKCSSSQLLYLLSNLKEKNSYLKDFLNKGRII